jgi:hypothetical protein
MSTSALRNLIEDNIVVLPDRDDLEEIRELTQRTQAKMLALERRGEKNRVRIRRITEVVYDVGN